MAKNTFGALRRPLACMGLGLLAAGGWSSVALAEWHYDCRFRIERREAALDRAAVRWGSHSSQTHRRLHALYDTREWCWRDHHTWWDGHAHIWVTTHW
jgi:hypothetical protein